MSPAIGTGDRGRVPFALVGVILLVGSATFATTVGRDTHDPEPAVDAVMERTVADARAVTRGAATRASVAAASNPVIEPADTTYGRALEENDTFEDALRIRIYRAAAAAFRSLEHRRRGVRTTVSMPPITAPGSMANASDRVTVSGVAGNRTRMAVTLENVTVVARRGERVVGRRTLTLRVRVDTPVLAVHDRVETYVDRLQAGVEKPGLTRQLTARLYAVAWARGYAQFGGAPIQNVVANRHVELLTNGALLDIQRSVFGRSDPDGRRARTLATGKVVVGDITGAMSGQYPPLGPLTKQVVRTTPGAGETTGGTDWLAKPGEKAPRPGETVEVDVGRSADDAFVRLLFSGGMNRTLQSVYSASVRTVAATETVVRKRPSEPEAPADNWTAAGSWVEKSTAARNVSGDTPSVADPSGYHRLETYRYAVDVTRTRVRKWRRGNETTTTKESATSRVMTTVALVGKHARDRHAPRKHIEVVHRPGGRFDGPNLADVEPRAKSTVVGGRGGPRELAGRAALGNLDTSPRSVRGDLPPGIYDWVYLDLAELRERVRTITVEVKRGQLGTYSASPAELLAETIRRKRSTLLDAPGTYPAVAGKARVAARGRYLAAVVARLEDRAADRDRRASSLDSRLREAGNLSLDRIRNVMANRRVGRMERADTARLDLNVDGAPPYLTLGAVEHEHVPAIEPNETVHPLVARNVNVAALPYADVVSGIVDAIVSHEPKTNLRTAARALRVANTTVERTGNDSLATRRDELRADVSDSVDAVRRRFRTVLDARDVGTSGVRTAVLDEAFGRYDTVHGRALAVANGTVAARVADLAERRASDDLDSNRSVDALEVALRTASYGTVETDSGRIRGPVVNATTSTLKKVTTAYMSDIAAEGTRQAVSHQTEKKWGKTLSRIPAGIPIAPVPGHWYATMNLWTVTVRGEYERFAVGTPRATPSAADASLHYVRDGDPVTLDVNGDGQPERLGEATRVRFGASTVVAVVVPPYKSGVGDVDGHMVETSPGWAVPGPTGREPDSWRVLASGWNDASDPAEDPDRRAHPRAPGSVDSGSGADSDADSDSDDEGDS